jgi:hypothetical protein
VGMKISVANKKSVWKFLRKLKIELLYDPAKQLLGTYPKEYKSTYNRDICTLMFIAALFTIAKLWNQPRYSSTNELIKKMCYIYTREYYLAIKTEIMPFVGKYMKLEIMLSEVSQAKKDKYGIFSLIFGI